MDTVLKLRELRARAGLTQDEVARRSRIGVKTISSFESGARIASLKLPQLESILAVYGVSLAQFFSLSLVHDLAPWDTSADPADVLTQRLAAFPARARSALIEKIAAMLDAAEAVLPNTRATSAPPRSHHLAIH
jgi:transcriptional regulator with XRE-family HTH domain